MKTGRKRFKGGARAAVLSALRSSKQGLTAPEIAEKLEINVNTVYIQTRNLLAEQLIKKIPERQHYRYFHRKVSDANMVALDAKPSVKSNRVIEKFTVDIEAIDLYNFLLKWQKTWEP